MKNFLLNLLTVTIIVVILAVGFTAVNAINRINIDTSIPPNLTNAFSIPAPAVENQGSQPNSPEAAAPEAAPVQVVIGSDESPEEAALSTAVEVTYEPEFLLACWTAREQGRRVSPKCPGNEAELLGVGR